MICHFRSGTSLSVKKDVPERDSGTSRDEPEDVPEDMPERKSPTVKDFSCFLALWHIFSKYIEK